MKSAGKVSLYTQRIAMGDNLSILITVPKPNHGTLQGDLVTTFEGPFVAH